MRFLQLTIISFIVVVISLQVQAQERTISGVVTDVADNFPLPGVNVVIKGTSEGTVTDINGNYSIKADAEDILVFSFVGYAPQEILVGAQAVVDVSMKLDVQSLEEVVVVGFGTTTERELTAAVSSIKSEDITKLNPPRIENALQGQIAGVQVTSGTGAPGGNQNIRIRGINSNGDNRPLIIVDGIRYGDDLNTIDPNIIESITVLKDASAAIYGVLAANGVVIVTTKTGKGISKPQLDVNGYYGWQESERRIDMLNGTEYALLKNESFVNGGQAPPFTDITNIGRGFDYQEEVFEITPIQSYSLNYRGNSEKTVYSAGASYFNQRGIVGDDKSEFDRINVNLNITHTLVDKLKLISNFNYVNVNRTTLNENNIGSVLFNALNHDPTINPVLPNGEFSRAPDLGIEIINPLAQIANTFNETENNRLAGILGLNYEVIEGLTIESSFNYNYANVDFREFFPVVDFGTDKVFNRDVNQVTQSKETFFFFNIDNLAKYERIINSDHKIQVTVGNSVFKTIGDNLTVTGRNTPNNSFEFADIRLATEFDDFPAFSSSFDTRQLSYFARAEYGYQSRYLFSGLVRRDATSIFAPGNQVGVFYSLSGGWVFSEEAFMPDLDFFSFGKLRVSYGELGNDRVDAFGFISLLDGEAEYVLNGELVTGRSIGKLPNPQLQWERTSQFDVGVDLGFFDDKLSVVADYYIKNTTDLLIPTVPASGLTGVAAPGSSGPAVNAGEARNRGWELSVSYNDEIIKGLNVSAQVNFARNDNEVIQVNDEDIFLFAGTFDVGQNDISRFQRGIPVGGYWGLQTDGLFQTAEEVAGSAQAGRAQPGDIRFVDLNNDGVINDDDRTFIGSPIPENIIGFSLSLDYKNFDLSTLWEAQTGHSLVRNYERNVPRANLRDDAINRWTGPGTSNSYPRLTTGATDNRLFSDFWVEDGDYLRIRNIQLGYTVPKELSERIKMRKARIYASVNNVFTFTDYEGFDPSANEGGALNGTNDRGFYPLARTYIIGFNLSF